MVSELDVASLLRKDGIKSIGHSYAWKAVDQMYAYGYHWNITCRACVLAVWLCIEGGMRVGSQGGNGNRRVLLFLFFFNSLSI